MGKADTLPVQIELSEAQYLVLLKHPRNSSRVAVRLLRVVEPETSARTGKRGSYLFTGFVTDALLLARPRARPRPGGPARD